MKIKHLLTITALGFLCSCATTKSYQIQAKSGTETSGTVTFSENNGEVEMKMTVQNLPPNSEHAAHIHEFGDCSSEDGKSAGGHWNPHGHSHGKWGHGEHHAGDLGNLKANEKGVATLTMKTDKWCLDCVDEKKNIIGKGIIIHAKADDFTTQPTGNAGGRIGCVEIR